MLIVLSSPSAAGKDSVRDLLTAWGLEAHPLVTMTTREPRAGEQDGREYHFVSEPEFESLAQAKGFFEHAIVYGKRYGVPRREITPHLEAGRDVIARVDVQGAETLKRLLPDALLIFIEPPSLEEAQRRLQERASDSDEAQRLRTATAVSEMEAARHFDYRVVNETGRLAETARRVWEIIASEKARRGGRGSGLAPGSAASQ